MSSTIRAPAKSSKAKRKMDFDDAAEESGKKKAKPKTQTVAELKGLLRAKNLPVKGKKSDLLKRLEKFKTLEKMKVHAIKTLLFDKGIETKFNKLKKADLIAHLITAEEDLESAS